MQFYLGQMFMSSKKSSSKDDRGTITYHIDLLIKQEKGMVWLQDGDEYLDLVYRVMNSI